MAAGKGRQFLLLFWKNWVIQKRKVCCTITELLIPMFLALILVLIRLAVDADQKTDPITWADFDVNDLPLGLESPNATRQWRLAYAPDNDVTQRLMASIEDQLTNVTGACARRVTRVSTGVRARRFNSFSMVFAGGKDKNS